MHNTFHRGCLIFARHHYLNVVLLVQAYIEMQLPRASKFTMFCLPTYHMLFHLQNIQRYRDNMHRPLMHNTAFICIQPLAGMLAMSVITVGATLNYVISLLVILPSPVTHNVSCSFFPGLRMYAEVEHVFMNTHVIEGRERVVSLLSLFHIILYYNCISENNMYGSQDYITRMRNIH